MGMFYTKGEREKFEFTFKGEKISGARHPLTEARHSAYRAILRQQLALLDIDHPKYKKNEKDEFVLDDKGNKIVSEFPITDREKMAEANSAITKWVAEQIVIINGIEGAYTMDVFFNCLRSDLVEEFVRQLTPKIEEEVKNSEGESKG